EIGSHHKVYFLDLGIRNAVIGDFNSIDLRVDAGFLWENFLFIERRKLFANLGKSASPNFWRSYSGAEVDYIEKTTNQEVKAFEFKLGNETLSKGAHSFIQKYGVQVKLVNAGNYLDFITQNPLLT
ncbi:MAG: DUF4143 domain-containing protein, partial [Patescibacteria group bacterium]